MSERRVRSVGRVRLTVPRLTWRPLGGLLGPDRGNAGQSLIALLLAATTSLITGFTIAGFQGTLREFPGLLLFIPAAIGLRGNVFGPLGGRLSTAIRTGTFSWNWRIDSILGQNVLAALASSMLAAVGIGVAAEVAALATRGESIDPIGISDFVVVSVFGGAMASVVVLAITLGLAVASARFGWDLDNVTAPLVSASGDFVTLPALVLATTLIGRDGFTRNLAIAMVIAILGGTVFLFRSKLRVCKRVVIESLPILILAGCLSLVAGIALERSLEKFLDFTVLLVLLPGFLASSGALGGILSNRLSTKVHLGFIEPARIPTGEARSDIAITYALALPLFVFLAILAGTAGSLVGETTPGLAKLVAVALTGGMVTTTAVAVIAYYGTLIVVRFGLDPDNTGIPIVSASLDVVGALTFVASLLLWGVA